MCLDASLMEDSVLFYLFFLFLEFKWEGHKKQYRRTYEVKAHYGLVNTLTLS